MHVSNHVDRLRPVFLIVAAGLLATACSSTSSSPQGAGAVVSTGVNPSGSPVPEASGGAISGDVPDNAVFLTYHGTTPTFSIQYVEGWQVTLQPDGVVIRDKDSSETVAIVGAQADVAGYVTFTDLPALQAQAGFQLVKRDTVQIGSASYVHLVFHVTSPPDTVTGKRLPLTVDRYYVPGPAHLAVVSLATPDGVDNVDAFLQMITSFAWS